MSYMSIYEEFSCGADLVISETVSQVRKKENSLKFCTTCRKAWQVINTHSDKKARHYIEYFSFGGGCIPERDWVICPDCKENEI